MFGAKKKEGEAEERQEIEREEKREGELLLGQHSPSRGAFFRAYALAFAGRSA